MITYIFKCDFIWRFYESFRYISLHDWQLAYSECVHCNNNFKYFKFDNAVQNVLGDNDRIKELLNNSVDVHEKIEKLFCLTFNLDNVGYFDENLYFELKEFVGELSESMQGIEKEMAAGVSVGVSSSTDPLVVKNSKAILALVCFYIELYALPDKLEDLKDASKSEIKDFVDIWTGLS